MSKHLLVVEDEPGIAMALEDELRNHGYEVELARDGDSAVTPFRFGDIEVNFSRREVTREGTPVPLTPLEFRLLEVFIRHRGRALGRQRLIDAAWGHDTFVTDRVVDNQVTNLRKKIEPNPDRPRYLVSLRGMGYRFDAEGVTDR